MANNSGPNKRLNGPDGRTRNTATSNAARTPGVPGRVGVPSVPGFGADYSAVPGATAGLASAYGQFQFVAAAMRQQRVGLKAGLKPAIAGVKAQAVTDMSGVINDAIDRGLTGSSDVSQQRVGVIAAQKTGVEAARQQVRQGILESKVQEQQAYMDYTIQQQQMQMQAAAARQSAALQEAAIAAQQQSSSAMLDYIKSQATQGHFTLPAGQTVIIKGVPVTITKGMTRTDIQQIVAKGQAEMQLNQARTSRFLATERLG